MSGQEALAASHWLPAASLGNAAFTANRPPDGSRVTPSVLPTAVTATNVYMEYLLGARSFRKGHVLVYILVVVL